MKVKTETFYGQKVDISVDDSGVFSAVVDGGKYSAPTLVALKIKLAASFRRASVRVAVPAYRAGKGLGYGGTSKGTLESVTLTGIHGRTRNVLIKRATGAAEQDSSSWSSMYFSEKTDISKYAKLHSTYKAAEEELEKFIEANKIDPKEAIIAALKKAGISDEDLKGD